ncbi:MAG: ParB N-terminal domain-containing protein, partial [Pseudomonadota bacterium]
MTKKKRRVFDIDFDTPADAVPAGTDRVERRGPMATAISETAEALDERAEAEAAIRAENDALAHEHVRLKKLGLITDLIPVAEVLTTKLTRDRAEGADPELDELKASIAAVGLSNPIRVEQTEHGYELIQGFRRL